MKLPISLLGLCLTALSPVLLLDSSVPSETAYAVYEPQSDEAAISGDGGVVAFSSTEFGPEDIILRDRFENWTQRIPTVGGDHRPSLSHDGNVVVWQGVVDDKYAIQVFDRSTHAIETITKTDISSPFAWSPSVSGDGRVIFYFLDVTSLSPAGLFAYDRWTRSTERLNIGVEVSARVVPARSNYDGSLVAFRGGGGTYIRDRLAGTTVLACNCAMTDISADFRYVVHLGGDEVPSDTNGVQDIYVYDRITGKNELISITAEGYSGNDRSDSDARITPDGRYVVFQSLASDLVPGDLAVCDTHNGWAKSNSCADVFVRDRRLGKTELVSRNNSGIPGNADSGLSGLGSGIWQFGISDDGRFVAFPSNATNLAQGAGGASSDVFVRDRLLGVTEWASIGPLRSEPPTPVEIDESAFNQKVLLISGLPSDSNCVVGDIQWLQSYLTQTSWIQQRAGINEADFYRYDYTSFDDTFDWCYDPNKGGEYASFGKLDSCWSLDDSYRTASSIRHPFGEERTLRGQARRLADYIDQHFSDDDRITIVAHSQGGVLAAYAIHDFIGLENRRRIRSLVTLDSPLQGIRIEGGAELYKLFFATECYARSDLRQLDSAHDMEPSSQTIKRLNTLGREQPGVRLYTINETGSDGCQTIFFKTYCIPEAVPDQDTRVPDWETSHISIRTGDHGTIWGVAQDQAGRATEEKFIGCAVTGLKPYSQCREFAQKKTNLQLAQDQLSVDSFEVRSGTLGVFFLTTWPGSTVTTALISPTGRRIDATTIAADVQHGAGNTAEWFQIDNPEIGGWFVELYGTDLPNGPELVEYQLLAIPDSTVDADRDGVFDDMDNCPSIHDPSQLDVDDDGYGDACDPDIDGDGIGNTLDNCRYVANPDQMDSDGVDGGDACDRAAASDADGDSVADKYDNCPFESNPLQEDIDLDGFGDACDPTDDRPTNDSFGAAFSITDIPARFGPIDTSHASVQPGEPSSCAADNVGASIWYSFTPQVSERLELNSAGSSFDTVLAIYTGSSVESLTPVACNDDFLSLQSRLELDVQQGTTYYVQLGGFGGAAGDAFLNVAPFVPEPTPTHTPVATSTPTYTATPTRVPAPTSTPSTDLFVAFDCDPASVGIQAVCSIGNDDVASIDLVLVNADVPGVTVGFVEFSVVTDQSAVELTPGSDSDLNGNPDFGDLAGNWSCNPPGPVADWNPDPAILESMLSCTSQDDGPSLAPGESLVLGTVSYRSAGAEQTVEFHPGWVSIYDNLVDPVLRCEEWVLSYCFPAQISFSSSSSPVPTSTATGTPTATATHTATPTATHTATPTATHTATPSLTCADLDGDGRVTLIDLLIEANAVLVVRSTSTSWDLNADGFVDVRDVFFVIRQLGTTC